MTAIHSRVFFLLLFASALHAQTLQIEPQALDLGTVKLGSSAHGEVFLKNSGTDALNILVRAVGDHFSATPETLALEPGEKDIVTVDFEAQTSGEHQGQLIVQVKTFFKKDPISLPLRAHATRARIHIDPPQTLQMGSLPVGTTARKIITLSNPGSVPLIIDSLYLQTADTPFHLSGTAPLELEPGGERILQVDFKPALGGLHQNQLFLHSADLDPPDLKLQLSGEALVPRAAFSPLPEVGLDFGQLEVGRSNRMELTILNQGRADLRIKKITVFGGAFTTVWDSTAAISLPSGERRKIAIDFRPRYEGPASGKVVLDLDDPRFPQVEIPLTGKAQLTPPAIEILNEDNINFGNVAIGKYERSHLVAWNRGGTPYTVRMDIKNTPLGEFDLEFPSLLLQPGEFKKVELKFSPKENGQRRSTLLMETPSGHRHFQLLGVGKFLALSPTTLDFDRVVVGEISTQQIELLNIGNADFTITNIRSNNPKNFKVKSQVNPTNQFVLPADGLRPLPLTVSFAPVVRGITSGILQLEGHWDEAFATRTVLLNGTGIAADLELHPSGSLEFDYVTLGERATQTLVATNTGDTGLQVKAHSETAEARAEPASFSLQPGESTPLQIFFSPATLGKRTAQIRLISNDVKEKALPLKIGGQGALANLDLTRTVVVLSSRRTHFDTLEVGWNNTPIVLHDQSKIDLVFKLPDSLHSALIGRTFDISWIQLDEKYDAQGGAKQLKVQIHDSGEGRVLVEKFNLRLLEKSNKRVRLTISTRNYPGAPEQKISQIFEAGGWKWEFEAKPLVSFLSVRPGRDYKDAQGNIVEGKTERLIGLPGFAFFGWHNSENPSISGVHLTATGNILEALSTENSIAVSLGVAISMYKDRFMFGVGWDVYDHRPKAARKGTQDYIMTFKYWGLF